MSYHPPKVISNNGATVYSADLAYEAHGKCGCQTVILSSDGNRKWRADDPALQPSIEGCTDYSNAYKIVALENTKFRGLSANNIAQAQIDNALVFSVSGFILKPESEILADFTYVEILTGVLIIYRDCSQS